MEILKAAERQFESSFFEIKQLLQADIFDSEIDTARELLKNEYIRAAGAVEGVVLEKHLQQVCASHDVVVKSKNPSISNYNEALKEAKVLDVPTWRFIQHLAGLGDDTDMPLATVATRMQSGCSYALAADGTVTQIPPS